MIILTPEEQHELEILKAVSTEGTYENILGQCIAFDSTYMHADDINSFRAGEKRSKELTEKIANAELSEEQKYNCSSAMSYSKETLDALTEREPNYDLIRKAHYGTLRSKANLVFLGMDGRQISDYNYLVKSIFRFFDELDLAYNGKVAWSKFGPNPREIDGKITLPPKKQNQLNELIVKIKQGIKHGFFHKFNKLDERWYQIMHYGDGLVGISITDQKTKLGKNLYFYLNIESAELI